MRKLRTKLSPASRLTVPQNWASSFGIPFVSPPWSWPLSLREGGTFYPAWADNSNSTHTNPNGRLNAFDVYTARVQLPTV